MRYRFFLLLLIGISTAVNGQPSVPDSLTSLFYNQLAVFPQEKIYLHTDKPCYIAEEKIWFRAHIADAVTHVPAPVSRYVYVELFNPLDSLITRVKIRNDNDAYHGYIDIPKDIIEGDYTLRAYTRYMLNLDESYLCTKRISIGNPKNRLLHTDVRFSFQPDGTTNMDFRFFSLYNNEPAMPKTAQVRINDGKAQKLKVAADGTAGLSSKFPTNTAQRVLLLEVNDPEYHCRQFIPIPAPDTDFDVAFYPEGGSMLMGTLCRVAFKVLSSDGRPANAKGAVYDQNGNKYENISASHQGMGYFTIYPEEGKSYYVECTNDAGQTKRFELPAALKTGYALSAGIRRDNIYISVSKSVPEDRYDTLYLLAHTRGMVHFAIQWEADRPFLNIPQEEFPSGVLHLVLFDAGMNPVSERVVFINNEDRAQVSYNSERSGFTTRKLVNNHIELTDEDGLPLSGSFSVAVTADHAVVVDSTSNILTQLLLTSDLRGHIENPAEYFKKDSASAGALDLLMMTQGWRRYDVAALTQGRPARPVMPIEFGQVISGRVKRLLFNRPQKGTQVSIVSSNGDYFDLVTPDNDGRFSFNLNEQPENTTFLIYAKSEISKTDLELLIDEETFPERMLPTLSPIAVNNNTVTDYVEKALKFIQLDESIWQLELPEVTVSAINEQKPPRQSFFYSQPNNSLVMDKVTMRPGNIVDLLALVPGVKVMGGIISIRGNEPPLIVIDDVIRKYDGDVALESLSVDEIEQIDVLKDAGNTAVFGTDGANGVVVVFTKRGISLPDDRIKYNYKKYRPLGYQQPDEFYAPKYDTPEKRDEKKPDLRTTIHWQPVVETNSQGIASFEFYTADEQTSYTVVIEGLTDNGKIIRKEVELWKQD